MSVESKPGLIGPTEARLYRGFILGLCIVSLVCVFQPVSLTVFTLGCVGIILGGLIFNVMPFCAEGSPRRSIMVALGWIVAVLFGMAALAAAAAYGYVNYLI